MRQPMRSSLVAVALLAGSSVVSFDAPAAAAATERIPRGTVVCTPAPSGMIAWWRFEGMGNNDSAGAHTLTFPNGATINAGHVGFGLSLDGVNQYATTPDSAEWDFGTSSFSIDFWFKFDVVPTVDKAFMAHSTGTGAQNKWILFYQGDPSNATERRFKMHFNGSLATSFVSNSVVLDTGYHHFALTRNAEFMQAPAFVDQWTFYLDGVNIGDLEFT